MILPSLKIIQTDNAINPSGTRNLGVGVSGFVKFLDTSSSGHLDFGFIDITTSGSYAGTKLIYFAPDSLGDATKIYNFKLHLSSTSTWGDGNYEFLWKKQIHFTSGVQLTLADDNVPMSLPTSSNVLSTASGAFIGAVAESGCSQYIYLDVYADTDVPTAIYGGPGNGGFRYRVTYDFI